MEIAILDQRDLNSTPLKFFRSKTFRDLAQKMEEQNKKRGHEERLIFVRNCEDKAGIYIDGEGFVKHKHHLSLQFFWRETINHTFEPITWAPLKTPFLRIQTFNDHFSTFVMDQKQKTFLDPSEEKESFEKTHGRKRYVGEPDEGFRTKLFRPTENDDGTVVIGGLIFPDNREKFPILYDHHFLEDYAERIPYISHLTRQEFSERAKYGVDSFERIATIEQFLDRKIPPTALGKMLEFLVDHHVILQSNPETGKHRLLSAPADFFKKPSYEAFGEEQQFFVVDNPKIDLDIFVGKFLITNQLGNPIVAKNNEMER